MKIRIFVILCIISLAHKVECYGSLKDFRLLDERSCSVLSQKDVQKLPLEYRQYLGFVKACNLKRSDADTGWRTTLVSIWAHHYLRSKGETSEWEEFPVPLLIDSNFKEIGRFPELYPMDWVTHLVVSYGKWHNGRPNEIRVDVSNPAVSGDYYYSPLQWNPAVGRYEMKSQQPTTGKRLK